MGPGMISLFLDYDAPLLEEDVELLGVLHEELVDRRLRARLRTIFVSPAVVVEDDVAALFDEPHGVERVEGDRVPTVIPIDEGKVEALAWKAGKDVLAQAFVDRDPCSEFCRVGPEPLLYRSIHEMVESRDLRYRRLGVLDEWIDPDQGPRRPQKLLEKEPRSLTFEDADLEEPEILFSL